MSRRKRVLLWAGLLVVLAVVWLIGAAFIPSRPSGLAEFKRIKEGMTREEVLKVIGRRADTTRPVWTNGERGSEVLHIWRVGESTIYVTFDEQEMVEDTHFVVDDPLPLIDRLRRWLGL
jgi:hypothetical protein